MSGTWAELGRVRAERVRAERVGLSGSGRIRADALSLGGAWDILALTRIITIISDEQESRFRARMTREDGPGWKPSHPLGTEMRLGAVPPSDRTGAAPPADGLASEDAGRWAGAAAADPTGKRRRVAPVTSRRDEPAHPAQDPPVSRGSARDCGGSSRVGPRGTTPLQRYAAEAFFGIMTKASLERRIGGAFKRGPQSRGCSKD